ncbi:MULTISPECIES: TetR/AcrR family transcriptional regulator [Dickeya]|uniref:TetR/AcrR family transcriptional regulator n=1 Tax=Dickeya TaxID=204037 RepID=UPI000AE289C0|nr:MULTISPECIES: TetR/AcrR family transcriptional regulator [Dickeya]
MPPRSNERLLRELAAAISSYPRSTLQELAELVSVSKATLYRNFGTREDLILVVTASAEEAVRNIIKDIERYVDDTSSEIDMAFNAIVREHFNNKEFLMLYCHNQSDSGKEYLNLYTRSLNNFFYKWQKNKFFRMDISCTELTELFISIVYGMIESVCQKRVAEVKVEEIIRLFFFYGSINNLKNS